MAPKKTTKTAARKSASGKGASEANTRASRPLTQKVQPAKGKSAPSRTTPDSEDDQLTPYTEGLRSRLATVTHGVSQSRIAQATQSSQSSIAHYLKGRKIPAEFCAQLARAFNVNAGWLLHGRGSQTPGHGFSVDERMVTELGALGENLRALLECTWLDEEKRALVREGADLLERQWDAQRSVNEMLAPLCRGLLDTYEEVLVQRRTPSDAADRALRLLRAASTDREFRRRALRTLALACEIRGDMPGAITCLRGEWHEAVAETGSMGVQQLASARKIALLLLGTGRMVEARQVARATLAAWEAAREEITEDWHVLRVVDGIVTMELGEADKGFEGVDLGYFELADAAKHPLREHYMLALLYNGYLSFSDCIGANEAMLDELDAQQRNWLCANMYGYAIWNESAEELALALEVHHFVNGPRLEPESTLVETYVQVLRRVFDKKATLADFPFGANDFAGQPIAQAIASICRCQFQRLLGDPTAAIASLEQSESLLQACQPHIHARFYWRALHFRNMLALYPENGSNPGRYRQALEFFNTHYLRGFGCLRNLSTESLLLF